MDEGSSGLPWIVELRIPGTPGVAKTRIDGRAVIGRVDRENDVFPDVDLTPWGALELGVAPEHVAIYAGDEHLNVVDLGSGKPTLLNGDSLEPNVPHRLEHGDDLQLGVMHLQVQVVASPTYGSVMHQQPGVTIKDEVTPGHGQRILIVEDDPEAAEIFRIVLERAGFSTYVCREVVSAIRALNTETPAAVLLDLMLPDIHGLELCRYIRRDIGLRDVPIIVVSAAVTQASISQAMDVGADVFLGKPVSMKEMVRVVASLIDWYAEKKPSIQTKRLDNASLLRSMPADVRRDAVVFFVAGYQEPIAAVVPRRITIGRRSGGTSPRPHIDLNHYGAFDAGVSRVHAAIHRDDDGFYIEDLGSSNGTWVNEELLIPHERHPLKNASAIRLGNLRLRVFLFTEEQTDLDDVTP